MKNPLLILSLLLFYSSLSAQFVKRSNSYCLSSATRSEGSAQFSNYASFKNKMNEGNTAVLVGDPPGLKMKKIGTTLTIGGSIFFVAGALLLSQADAYYYNSTTTNGTTTTSGDPKGGFGVVMVAAGLGMMIPGIIFWSKGAKKYNAYKQQQNLSLRIKGDRLSLQLML